MSAGYVGNYAQFLPVFIDTNVAPATTTKTYDIVDASGSTVKSITVPWYTARKTAATANILTGFSSVESWYHSLAVTVKKPLSHGITGLASYTFAHANDGGQVSGVNGTFNGTDTPIDPYDLGAEWGRSDLDIRQRFSGTLVASPTFSGSRTVKMLANGWTFSTTYTAQSGCSGYGFHEQLSEERDWRRRHHRRRTQFVQLRHGRKSPAIRSQRL